MISFERLCNGVIEQIEEIARDQESGLSFSFVVDTGSYEPPERNGNEVVDYINGVFTLTSSDIASLPDKSNVVTQTARLDLLVRLPDLTADEVYNDTILETVKMRIDAVRKVITELVAQNRTDEYSGYSVSTIFQNASSGERAIYPNVGDGFSFSIVIYWILIENGINTRSFTFVFDRVLIPYQAVTLNNSKTFDSNVYADTSTGRVENTPIQANWSATFELPAIKGVFWNEVLNCLTGNDKLNTVHCLAFNTATSNNSYLVNIGEVTLNGETVKNAGLKVSFFEARYNYYFVSLPAEYKRYKATSDTNSFLANSTLNFYIPQKTMKPVFIPRASDGIAELVYNAVSKDEYLITTSGIFLDSSENYEEVTPAEEPTTE